MTLRPAALLTLAACGLALSACAKDADLYPSLSIRDAERVTGVFEPVEAEPYVPPPQGAETIRTIAKLRSDAAATHQRFLAAADRARGPVSAARGAAMGSDAWSTAQIALADLESIRSEAMLALADLDRIYVDAQLESSELTEIEAARAEVDMLVGSETNLIDALYGEIAG